MTVLHCGDISRSSTASMDPASLVMHRNILALRTLYNLIVQIFEWSSLKKQNKERFKSTNNLLINSFRSAKMGNVFTRARKDILTLK